MASPETIEASPDADVAAVILSLNKPLLEYAESPWFRAMAWAALPRTEFGGSSIWGVLVTDGAVIYTRRSWDEHEAPVSIKGADMIDLTLQRPGEAVENRPTKGVSYRLRSREDGAEWRLLHDGHNKERRKDEVLGWAGVDSPAALVRYIDDAIHHGRVHSAMHRTTAKYAALTPKRFIISLFASMEATVKQGQSTVDRSLLLGLDAAGAGHRTPRSLVVAGKIVQTDPPEWSLRELEAFGARLGLGSHANAVSTLTPGQLAEARRFGNSALRHCEATMRSMSEQATGVHAPAQATV